MIIINSNFSIIYHSAEQQKKIEGYITQIKNNKSHIYFQTSGSTGNPKTIRHSKKAISTSAKKTIDYFQLTEKKPCCPLPICKSYRRWNDVN